MLGPASDTEHIEGDAEDIFRHACKLKLGGIVSKLRRIVLPLRPVKMKNPTTMP